MSKDDNKELPEEKIYALLTQLDEYIKVGNDIKLQLEAVLKKLDYANTVHEKRGGYCVNPKQEAVLMPDYLTDENNNIIGIEFTLVKEFGTPF